MKTWLTTLICLSTESPWIVLCLFVWIALSEANQDGRAIANSSTIANSQDYEEVDDPVPGDVIWWPGHVGLVVDPVAGIFVGAQVRGRLNKEVYREGSGTYWASRTQDRRFFRYDP